MRLINIDDIMRLFPNADIDADAFDNLQAYPYWKTDITGLINILKQTPTVEMAEDCVKREDVKSGMIKYGFLAPDMTVTEFVENLPSVQPQPKTLSDAEINTFVDSMKNMRKATKEESKSTVEYIDSISKPTGFLFDEAYEDIDFVATHKKLSVNLQLCNDCVSREAAKVSIQRKIDELVSEDGSYDCDIKQYINGLLTAKIAISSYNLPSVQLQPKRGKFGGDDNGNPECTM